MADDNTIKNLVKVVREIEEMKFEGPGENCQAHIRQELLEVLYKADELLECLMRDSADALPPLKLKPQKDKKKGSV